MKDEIIEAAARAFYVSRWANDQEEKPGFRGFGGGDLMDMAPRTPKKVLAFGKKFIRAVEAANGGRGIETLYRQAESAALAPGGMRYARRRPTPDLFGHYLAMAAMGSGVAWTDDYPETGIIVPDAEWHGGGQGEISSRFKSARA